jgi:hypothetical protein
MNKLRAFSYVGGGLVVALALWATVRYGGSPIRYAEGLALGLVAAGLPRGAAGLKAHLVSLRRRLADRGDDGERGTVFVSESAVGDPVGCLETIAAAVREDDSYDGVERDSFRGGPGLTVTHRSFDSSLVRLTAGDRVAVVGASSRTETLVDTVSRACSLSFERARENPFAGVAPVSGGARVILALLVFLVALAGVNAVGAAAYPSDAYNPAERTVLVGVDAQASLDPRASATDARLRKASFLVAVVEEEATEVRWERDDAVRIARHGRQALRASGDARALLIAVREGSPTAAQTRRADRIERELHAAERSVATALDRRSESDALGDAATLDRLGERLRAAADTPVATGDAALAGRSTRGVER